VVATIDVVTAACAALNFAYFARRFSRAGDEGRGAAAAAVLAMVSLGMLVESVALLALAAQGETVAPLSGTWSLVRALPVAGTAAMSALVARRLVER
jgi:hypothetical protein